MKDLIIEKSGTTPSVVFLSGRGVLKLEGRSIPENPESFYEGLIVWIHDYFKDPKPATRMEVRLEYVNSGTSKYLMEIFRIFKEYEIKGHPVSVEWYYEEEDEAMYELGRHYQDAVKIPIHLNIIY